MTLIEFLLARLNEDEERGRDRHDHLSVPPDCWGPGRVLAEVAAKRAILEHCRGSITEGEQWNEATQVTDATHTLKLLASVYADHPDYDEEWLVTTLETLQGLCRSAEESA